MRIEDSQAIIYIRMSPSSTSISYSLQASSTSCLFPDFSLFSIIVFWFIIACPLRLTSRSLVSKSSIDWPLDSLSKIDSEDWIPFGYLEQDCRLHEIDFRSILLVSDFDFGVLLLSLY